MRSNTKWSEAQTAEGGQRLPEGGYVIRITKVEDVPSKEYLWIEYDIAEGQYKGHYSDEYSRKNPYIHRFARSYSEKATGFFAAFLHALEDSNPNFHINEWEKTTDENAFVGLVLGALFGLEDYTNDRGDDKTRLVFDRCISADKVRKGEFTVPKRRDSRTKVAGSPMSTAAVATPVIDDSEVPF